MQKNVQNKNQESSQYPARVFLLDRLRGIAVINMVLFHGLYDVVFLFGVSLPWYIGFPGYVWQQAISWCFILVSGASLHYSSKPFRRGIFVFACGAVISLITYLFMPGELIWFGILHFMGSAMLITAFLVPMLKKIPSLSGVLLSSVLFVFLKGVPRGFVGFLDIPLFFLPQELYQTSFLFPLGFPSASFQSSDYFPLLPWLFLYIAGFYGWSLVQNKIPLVRRKATPMEEIGKNSLWIYMVHQPILYGMLWCLFKLLGME